MQKPDRKGGRIVQRDYYALAYARASAHRAQHMFASCGPK